MRLNTSDFGIRCFHEGYLTTGPHHALFLSTNSACVSLAEFNIGRKIMDTYTPPPRQGVKHEAREREREKCFI